MIMVIGSLQQKEAGLESFKSDDVDNLTLWGVSSKEFAILSAVQAVVFHRETRHDTSYKPIGIVGWRYQGCETYSQ